jgi:L-alanine-DL-glutamate epimerase-like enolase superfamily enzyme
MKIRIELNKASKTMPAKHFIITVSDKQLPLKNVFRISRGAKTHANVIVVTIKDGVNTGWAEAVLYARYQESIEIVKEQIRAFSKQSLDSENIDDYLGALSSGAALDCAWWDLKAKVQNPTVAYLLRLMPAAPCITAQTSILDTPDAMAKAVTELNTPPLVKVKLDNKDIVKKMTAIQQASPNSVFIVDANEGWSINYLTSCCEQIKALNVVLIEQPLPAGQDQDLINFISPIPLCADESCHTREEF